MITFRPHVALSTNQTAYDCALLERVIEGDITMKQYEQEAIVYGKKKGMVSILMGLFGMSWYISLL